MEPTDERLQALYEEPRSVRERHYGLMFRDPPEFPLPNEEGGQGDGDAHSIN